MRWVGWTLLIAGVVLAVLLGLSLADGGRVSAEGWFAVFIATSYGAALRKAKPRQRRTKAADGSAVANDGTVEVPLTPPLREALRGDLTKTRRRLVMVYAGIAATFIAFGVWLQFDVPRNPGVAPPASIFSGPAALMTAICLGVGVVLLLVWLPTERRVARDLRETTYLRTTGPVQLVPILSAYQLSIGDQRFIIPSPVASVLRTLSWATVDYTRHHHAVLTVAKKDGTVVFQLGSSRRRDARRVVA